MIPITHFTPNPLRQNARPICIPCSYASAVSPLAKIDDSMLLHECNSFADHIAASSGGDMKKPLGLTSSASDYDVIEALHNQCPHPIFVAARGAIRLCRLGNNLEQWSTRLKVERATGILVFTYRTGRAPHSVSVAYDQNCGFFVRDSAQPNGWRDPNLPADATGLSVVEAIEKLYTSPACGEAILFLPKQTQSAPPRP